MKERMELTRQPQTPYSKSGEIFMSEPGTKEFSKETPPTETPVRPAVANAQRLLQEEQGQELTRKASPQMQKTTQKAWELYYRSQGIEMGKLSVSERRTLRDLIDAGISPSISGAEEPDEPEEVIEPLSEEDITDIGVQRLIQKYNLSRENGTLTANEIQEIERLLTQRMMEPTVDEEEQQRIQNIFTQLHKAQAKMGKKEIRRGGLREKSYSITARAENFFEGLRVNGRIKNDAELTPEELATKRELYQELVKILKEAPSVETGLFPSEILGAVRYFRELREGLISEIIFKSFEEPTETGHYEIDLYAGSNLNVLLGYLKADGTHDPEILERFKYFFSLKTAANYFHTMNAGILTGNFEEFGRIAERINYQHFENMQQVRGMGLVMRLYEQKYNEYMAKEDRITEESYKKIKEEIEKTFTEMNRDGLVRSEYEEERTRFGVGNGRSWELEPWEVAKALGVGRTFFNITLRGAEKIAVGHFPEDRTQFTSFPQEDMVRVMNWREWILRRFDLGKTKHGQEFLDKVGERYQEFLRYKGRKLGINRLEKFGGIEVERMEFAGQYNTSGVYSGWRLENMAYKKIYLRDGNLTIQDHVDFSENHKLYDGSNPNHVALARLNKDRKAFLKNLEERSKKNPEASEADLITEADQKKYLEFFKPLLDNLDIGFGTLMKRDAGGKGKLSYLVRTEIWKKVAQKNIPLMMEYLSNLEYAKNSSGDKAKTLKQIGEDVVSAVRDQEWKDLSSQKWSDFRKKVFKRHEIMVQRSSLSTKLTIEQRREQMARLDALLNTEEFRYNQAEAVLLEKIQNNGAKLAPDLADVEFPYTPFMNDIPFDELDYTGPGQTFYKRRTGGDLGGYNKGQQAFTKLVTNPGGIGLEKVSEVMSEIVEAIAGPEGDKLAQEANFANLEVILDITMAEPGKRQSLLKEVAQMMRKPTSIAQQWAGMESESIIETEASNFLEKEVKTGTISRDLATYMRKKKHATFAFFIWALFRDILWVTPAIAGVSLISQLKKAA